MQTSTLGASGVVTSVLGLGCATLFRAPSRSERRRVLDAAAEAGIRHFDVAPSYGLDRAEPELADFLRGRRHEVTVTTKFGIATSLAGRVAGLAQPPVRAALQRVPQLQRGLERSGRGPASGVAGRALYRSLPLTPAAAEAALTRSLRRLRTDYVDIFLIHEPPAELTGVEDLVAQLEAERARGRIRAWGTAEDSPGIERFAALSLAGIGVVQYRADLFTRRTPLPGDDRVGRIRFGVLAAALPALSALTSDDPRRTRQWSERIGLDLGRRDEIAALLLRHAVAGDAGPVLFSSTRPERVQAAAAAVDQPLSAAETAVLDEMAAAAATGGASA